MPRPLGGRTNPCRQGGARRIQGCGFTRMPDDSWGWRREQGAYAVLALSALAFVLFLWPGASGYFERFFGSAHPVGVVVVAGAVGAICLRSLRSLGGFHILRRGATLRGVATAAALATVLAVAIVVADHFIRYPEDMNVPVPQALLFYPAMGFVAEIIFHVLPLTLVLILLRPSRQRLGAGRLVWLAIAVAAVAEPTFQVLFDGGALAWADLYTWVHVCAIALLQMYVFRRYDFVSMYSFRLIYYAYWHIAWGMLRQELLF